MGWFDIAVASLTNLVCMEPKAKPHPLEVPADATVPQRHPDAPAPGEEIASHYSYCFGCGVDHPTGLHMRMTARDGMHVTAVFEITDSHQGAPGIGHGGLLGLACDEALGATNNLINVPAVTAHLEVSYRAPVPVGSKVFIDAFIVAMRGRKIWATAEGRLNSPDGQIAVVAKSLFMQVPIEHFIKYGRPEDVAAASNDPHVLNHVNRLDIAP